MIKREELTNPNSCLNRARDNEMTFVLLGRDIAAPSAIRAWVEARLWLGKNSPDDPQIKEALDCAAYMESQHDLWRAHDSTPTPETPQYPPETSQS